MNQSETDIELPFVSLCTPTFNRRPFIFMAIKCFLHQTYPRHRMEWIIIDDGTDKIADCFDSIPEVRYYPFDTKLTLGKKRNLMHEYSKGEYLVYIDDDDYYPPDRVSHSIEMLLKNPQALCAGSSLMHVYFKHIQKMHTFGPYGPNHATAATFAFPRKLLEQTSYEETACLAEEKHFLKNYTIPMVQLDPLKTILVFSHIHNTFDKKGLLDATNPHLRTSSKTVEDFVKDDSIKSFILLDIDDLLSQYSPGDVKNKPDVLTQIEEIKKKREEDFQKQQQQHREKHLQTITKMSSTEVAQMYESQLMIINQQLHTAREQARVYQEENTYLKAKITQVIQEAVQLKQQAKAK